jgi:PhnB protein
MPVKPIPDGYHAVTPYLTVTDAAKLIEFMKQAFDAEEVFRMEGENGVVRHAEIRLRDSMLMVAEARDEWKPMPSSLYLYVPDTDTAYQRALRAGGRSLMEPANQFYGDRNAGVTDPCGNFWWIGTHIEDVPPEEIKRREAQAQAQQTRKK